jgi:molybdopterin/thiamine biosynthesis adenylyltransferase
VGTIGLVDFDVVVSQSATPGIHGRRTRGARSTRPSSMNDINPFINVSARGGVESENALDIIKDYDLVADG